MVPAEGFEPPPRLAGLRSERSVATVTPRGHAGWRSETCTRGLVFPKDALCWAELFPIMALRAGVDPATFRSTGGRSTVELPKHVYFFLEVRAGLEPAVGGLQPHAFPLGHLTSSLSLAESGGFEPHALASAASFRDSVPTGRRHSPLLVADLGTAPSYPAYETGIVSSRPPCPSRRPIENPGPSIFAGAPHLPVGFRRGARPSQPRGSIFGRS